jgi:hypothetical protein
MERFTTGMANSTTNSTRINSIQQSQEFFFLRDKTDSEELLRDIGQAIAVARNGNFQRLWIFTNANPVTIRIAKARLDQRAIANLLSDFQILNPLPSEEINLRWIAINQGIPTLIVDSKIETQSQALFENY